MAANFKIDANTETDGLHLKLSGDFDGTSALELSTMLRTYAKRAEKIFVDTSELGEVWGFGQTVFEDEYLGLHAFQHGASELVLTGNKLTL